MRFGYSTEIWRDYPQLVPGVLAASGISADVAVGDRTAGFLAQAEDRLKNGSEGELPEIQAWRRVFSRMGFKPTQYRCASEALLRRFKKEGALPAIHPLIDLCNAVSVAFAIPVAVFDTGKIVGDLEVRYADGGERYETFSGELETPDPGEVIFADAAGRAHARRWTNRQSGYSAVREQTATVVVVAEALHADARRDVEHLIPTLAGELEQIWCVETQADVLSRSSSRFDVDVRPAG